MKKTIGLIFLSFCLYAAGQTDNLRNQADTIRKNVKIQMNIRTLTQRFDHVFLEKVTDSSLVYSQLNTAYASEISSGDKQIAARDLLIITCRKKGAAGRGALLGGGIGVALGLIIGLADGNDSPNQFIHFSAGQKAVALGITFGVFGAIIGTVKGLFAHKTFAVNSPENFRTFRNYINRKVYKKIEVNY